MKNVKSTVSWTYVISHLSDEEIDERFHDFMKRVANDKPKIIQD